MLHGNGFLELKSATLVWVPGKCTISILFSDIDDKNEATLDDVEICPCLSLFQACTQIRLSVWI